MVRLILTLAEKHSFDIRNEEETKRTLLRTRKPKADFIVGTLGFVVLACTYSIANREVTDGFRHLIYGKQSEKVIQRDMSIGGILTDFSVNCLDVCLVTYIERKKLYNKQLVMDKPTYEKFKRYCISKNYGTDEYIKSLYDYLNKGNGRRQMEWNQ